MLLGPKASHLQRVVIPNQTSSFWLGLIPAEGASLASLEWFNLRGGCFGEFTFPWMLLWEAIQISVDPRQAQASVYVKCVFCQS